MKAVPGPGMVTQVYVSALRKVKQIFWHQHGLHSFIQSKAISEDPTKKEKKKKKKKEKKKYP